MYNKFYPVLRGGGGGRKTFQTLDFPIFNDRSLTFITTYMFSVNTLFRFHGTK